MSVKTEEGIEYEVLSDCLLFEIPLLQLSAWCDELRVACRDMKKLGVVIGHTVLTGVTTDARVPLNLPSLIKATIMELSTQGLDWIQEYSNQSIEE